MLILMLNIMLYFCYDNFSPIYSFFYLFILFLGNANNKKTGKKLLIQLIFEQKINKRGSFSIQFDILCSFLSLYFMHYDMCYMQ
jgi:hypothetical protein